MATITPAITGVRTVEPTTPLEALRRPVSVRRWPELVANIAPMPPRVARRRALLMLACAMTMSAGVHADEAGDGSADYGGYAADQGTSYPADRSGFGDDDFGARAESTQNFGSDFGGVGYQSGFLGCAPGGGRSIGQRGLRTELVQPPAPRSQGEDKYIRLGVTVAETYTDNVTLASDENAESDFITQVVPSLVACANSGRVRAALSYQLQALRYQNNSQFDDIYNDVSGETTIEVVPSRVFLDADTSYGQAVVDPANTFSRTNTLRPGNRTSAWISNISPYALQGLGPVGRAMLRYRYGRTEFGDSDLPETELHGVYFNVTSPPENSLWSWQANVLSQRVERSGGDLDAFFDDSDVFEGDDFDSADARTTHFDKATLDLGYQLTESLRLLALGGVENEFNRDGSTDRLSSPLWNAGFLWTSAANSLEARYGERYFGSNYFVDAVHRGANFDLSLSYQEDTTVSGLNQLNGGALGGGGGFRRPRTSLFDRGVFVQKRLLATLGYDTAFTRTTLRAFDESRNFVQSATDEDVYGADLQVEYQAASRTSITPRASWEHRDSGVRSEADIAEAGISLAYLVTPLTQAALGYSHAWRNAETDSGSYEENRIVVQFSTYYWFGMYEAFYNLSAGPFQLMPDPRFLFPSADHQRALSYLLYGLQRREGFVVITGDVGIGKTLLVQTLIGEIGDRNLSVARVAMANLDADGVLPMVASAFGLPHESRSKIGLLNDLVARILPTYNRGALLIVDEAQTCTPAALEELRAISNLQAHGRALLQVFLVGQTDLRATLADPKMEQLRQRVITSHHLRPLDVDEVRDYVQHRLVAAGWHADPSFTESVYPRVQAWSRGIPRRINLLMDRFLLYGYLESLHELDESHLQAVIDELDAELADQYSAPSPELPAASIDTRDIEQAEDRIHGVERAFTAAVGESRARQFLEKHEASAQTGELVALNLRIARLESLLADQSALDVLQTPQSPQSAADDAAAKPADQPTGGSPQSRPVEPDFDVLNLRPTAEASAGHAPRTPPRKPPPQKGTPAGDGPRRGFFSRRKKHET